YNNGNYSVLNRRDSRLFHKFAISQPMSNTYLSWLERDKVSLAEHKIRWNCNLGELQIGGDVTQFDCSSGWSIGVSNMSLYVRIRLKMELFFVVDGLSALLWESETRLMRMREFDVRVSPRTVLALQSTKSDGI
ncbi:hypothetical protein L9F63_001520, partial [Diploptera punctata]